MTNECRPFRKRIRQPATKINSEGINGRNGKNENGKPSNGTDCSWDTLCIAVCSERPEEIPGRLGA